jgi:hypothetical protein
MNLTRSLISILIFAFVTLMITSAGFASNSTNLEKHDFDSYFTMDIPKGISFEKKEGMPSKDINFTVNYKEKQGRINIIYTESIGAKDNLLKYYEDFAKNDPNITLNTTNNTTVVHFKDTNFIGETNYHDLAISGDDDRYLLIQCDNESLMKSMAKSIRFK